jgi:NAD(P)-dependent dehydrogenase (short-subunit alcohol dehydrogenase family)
MREVSAGALVELFGLPGKVALVTGGGSGLGYAFASVLAAAGAEVVVADVNEERASKAASELGAAALTLDVSDRLAVDAAVDQVVAARGHLDIAFANAGVARGTPPLVESGQVDVFGLEDYDDLIDVNLHGVVYTVRAAARHMKRQRSGRGDRLDRGHAERPVRAVLVRDREGGRDQLREAGGS